MGTGVRGARGLLDVCRSIDVLWACSTRSVYALGLVLRGGGDEGPRAKPAESPFLLRPPATGPRNFFLGVTFPLVATGFSSLRG